MAKRFTFHFKGLALACSWFLALRVLPVEGGLFYDEVVWTRKAWSSYKLSFPLDKMPGKPGLEGPAYSSLIGPFERDFYKQQIERNKAARCVLLRLRKVSLLFEVARCRRIGVHRAPSYKLAISCGALLDVPMRSLSSWPAQWRAWTLFKAMASTQ